MCIHIERVERDDDDDRYEQGLRQSIVTEISNARDCNIEYIALRTTNNIPYHEIELTPFVSFSSFVVVYDV